MKALDKSTKFAHLGKPGTAFSKGFQRRLDIITKLVDFKDKKILDLGCGEGVWIPKWLELTNAENVYGEDIDPENLTKILNTKFEIPNKSKNPKIQKSKNLERETGDCLPAGQAGRLETGNFKACPAEKLDFPDNTFDIVFSNEVMEHVADDVQVMREVLRVLKPGGKYVFFTPNRGWPFETHGMFWRGKYIWGNIPFLPWMPSFVRKRFAPHVRNYSNGDIKGLVKSLESRVESTSNGNSKFETLNSKQTQNTKLLPTLPTGRQAGQAGKAQNKFQESKNPKVQGADTYNLTPDTFEIIYHSHVFPAFDKLERKFGIVGRFFQKLFHLLERTPLHFFGISHLVIVQKVTQD